jgi:hypothetical protein
VPTQFELHDADCGATLDARALPLLMASWLGAATAELVDQYFDAQLQIMQEIDSRGEHCVLLTMADQAGRPSAVARQRIVDRTQAISELIQRVIVANAIVVTNPLVRGAMTAIGWLDPKLRGVPYLGSRDAGFEWAKAELARHGLPAPDLSKLELDAVGQR